jgi:hypothetical protein
MARSTPILDVLQMLAPQSLILVTYLAGAVFAVTRWKLHSRVSLLALLAVALGCLNIVGVTLAHLVVPRLLNTGSVPMESVRYVYLFISLFSSVLHAAVLALLFTAAFARRNTPARSPGIAAPPISH